MGPWACTRLAGDARCWTGPGWTGPEAPSHQRLGNGVESCSSFPGEIAADGGSQAGGQVAQTRRSGGVRRDDRWCVCSPRARGAAEGRGRDRQAWGGMGVAELAGRGLGARTSCFVGGAAVVMRLTGPECRRPGLAGHGIGSHRGGPRGGLRRGRRRRLWRGAGRQTGSWSPFGGQRETGGFFPRRGGPACLRDQRTVGRGRVKGQFGLPQEISWARHAMKC